MEFDKTNKVIVESMNQDEARVFILFLKSEIARHQADIDSAVGLIYNVITRFKLGDMLEEDDGYICKRPI